MSEYPSWNGQSRQLLRQRNRGSEVTKDDERAPLSADGSAPQLDAFAIAGRDGALLAIAKAGG